MTAKNLSIETRLRRHPDIRSRRSGVVIGITIAVTLMVLVGWMLLIAHSRELTAEFAELQDTAVTVNQRVGSRFGVLLGIIFLPIMAICITFAGWAMSQRFVRRGSATPLKRTYRGAFALSAQHGDDFYEVLSTRSAEVIGTLHPSRDRGNLVIEAWCADADEVAYVGVYAFDLKHDPGWELVEFSGADFSAYKRVFDSRTAT